MTLLATNRSQYPSDNQLPFISDSTFADSPQRVIFAFGLTVAGVVNLVVVSAVYVTIAAQIERQQQYQQLNLTMCRLSLSRCNTISVRLAVLACICLGLLSCTAITVSLTIH